MVFLAIVLISLPLGISLMAIGAYMCFAARNLATGVSVVAAGLVLSLLPIAFLAFLTIVTDTPG